MNEELSSFFPGFVEQKGTEDVVNLVHKIACCDV